MSSKNTYEKTMEPGEVMEICLCPICARQFYNSLEHVIQRKDSGRVETDTCAYCDVRPGFDFVITKRRKRLGDDIA